MIVQPPINIKIYHHDQAESLGSEVVSGSRHIQVVSVAAARIPPSNLFRLDSFRHFDAWNIARRVASQGLKRNSEYFRGCLGFNGRLVTNWQGRRLRGFRNLLLTISSKIEGWRVEAWTRQD